MLPDDVRDMTNEQLGDYMRTLNKEIYRISRLKRMTQEEKDLRLRHLQDQLEPAENELERRVHAEDWQRAVQGLRPSEGYGRPGYKPRRREGRQRLIRARRAAGLSQAEAAAVLDLPVYLLQSLESIEEGDESRITSTPRIWEYGDVMWQQMRRNEPGD